MRPAIALTLNTLTDETSVSFPDAERLANTNLHPLI